MSQYSSPGVLKQNQGADFRGTPGLHVPGTQGIGTKAVPRSELDQAVSLLESAYQSAVAAETAARESAIAAIPDGLTSAEVQTLINAAVAGGIRYKGLATADAATPQVATGHATFATGDMYRISSNGSSAFSVPLNVGDMVVYNDVGGWDKIDNTDPTVTAPTNDPIAVSQTTPGSYEVSLKPAFVSRVSTIETDLAATQGVIEGLQNYDAAVDTAFTGIYSDIATINAANASQDLSIAALQTGLGDAVTVSSTQAAAITALQNRATTTEAIDTTQDVQIQSLQTNLTGIATTLESHTHVIHGINMQLAVMATVSVLQEAIANFYSATHRIMMLTAGVFDAAGGTTIFYLEPFDTLKFAVVRLSEAAAPYEELGRPRFEYVSVDNLNNVGNFVKITFFSVLQVPNSTVKAYCEKFYDDGEPITVALPSRTKAGLLHRVTTKTLRHPSVMVDR